ncbi:MAG: hypothetical protein KDD64_08990 [Bdellovibrionales bacterium]|nr:hypothetical protein [Bdellovibrionales bacterium]
MFGSKKNHPAAPTSDTGELASQSLAQPTALRQRAEFAIEQALSHSGRTSELILGPISPNFQGAVCALEKSHLYGCFGDMMKAPNLSTSEHPFPGEEHIVSVHFEGSPTSSGLKYVFVEDWKRDDSVKIGNPKAIQAALELAETLGVENVAIPLPNCCSQYFFTDVIKMFEGQDPDQLSPEELRELGEYCDGVKEYFAQNPDSNIKNITFVWSRDYRDLLEGNSSSAHQLR